ncbi:transglutaminase-like domain-containing protein [Kibdelosporangium phytohabitans]|uniref:Transglutaminase-like superfamily protein n=1 Tax=Kibdelosporangium phytohabitans TaxID=860235 RepID=A0A0N9I3Y2_9PSEU|nr:transglutaminase-like domain-containing protein [Kibdelosporangium phytohabitans]ALG09243.1 transglutaminase-like superfamily protein [Kibdelosporangium phytohabitans]MBE1469517.1 transglutaminase-like putative cysteine protease [Kibdelosporangium phytohabitans]
MTTDLIHPDLTHTDFLDHDSVAIQQFVRRVVDETSSLTQQAIALYRAVRDDVLYEVYGADLSREGLRASTILRRGTGMCVHKSVLYAASLRAIGVPSRLVLTDVRNHLASQRLRDLVGGDVFRFHCLVAVRLNDKWVKATPVFNSRLCKLYGIAPLEFDGTADSLHHPFDLTGRQHMEFLHTHGEFADLPHELLLSGLRAAHPRIFATADTFAKGSLVAEAR